MKKNMGTKDSIVRVLIAIVIGVLYYTDVIAGTLGVVLLVISGVFVLTSIVNFCPIYSLFGVKTCSIKKGA